MFTIPVGMFSSGSNLIRPTSVVDTPGPGSIVNSSKAYDGDPNSFASFNGAVASPGPYTTYSVFSFSSPSSFSMYKALNVRCSWDGVATSGAGRFDVSIDAGATYAPGNDFAILGWSTSPANRSIYNIPSGTIFSNIRVRLYMGSTYPVGSLLLYDIFV